MKIKKYRLNLRKVKRNILILLFLILSISYVNFMNTYTNENIKNCQAFTKYAQQNGISLTQDNYKIYLSMTNNK
jgi:hypothetical protein